MNIIIIIEFTELIVHIEFFELLMIGINIEISKSKIIKIRRINMKLIDIEVILLLILLNPHSIGNL